MKVLIYTDDPGFGGTAINNQVLAVGLADRGLSVAFAASSIDVAFSFAAQRAEKGIANHWLDYDTTLNVHKTSFSYNESLAILNAAAPNVVLFSDGSIVSNIAAKKVAAYRNIPYVVLVNLVDPQQAVQYADLMDEAAAAYRGAHAVIAVSQENQATLQDLFGLPSDLCQVIYNGRPDLFFASRDPDARCRLRMEIGVPSDAVLCLTTARYEERKGYQYQVDAIRHLGDKAANLHFVWAGHEVPGFGSQLRRIVSALPKPENVHLLGPRTDVIEWLDAADLFLLPSEAEGMPLCISEAMAKGLPVVASAVSGIPEQLGDAGVLLPPPREDAEATVDALATAIADLATHPNRRVAMGQACRQRAEVMFREGRMVARYAALLEEAARSRPNVQTDPESVTAITRGPCLSLGQTLNFGDPQGIAEYLKHGWSHTESWGTWTDGQEARLVARLEIPEVPAMVLVLEAGGFSHPSHPVIDVTVTLNGVPIGALSAQGGLRPQRHAFVVPMAGGWLDIRLQIANPASPAVLGLSDDGRLLGLAVTAVRLTDFRDLAYIDAMTLRLPDAPGLSRDMWLLALCHADEWASDVPQPQFLNDPILVELVLAWWMLHGRSRFPLVALPSFATAAEVLARPAAGVASARMPVTCLMWALHRDRPDLAQSFDLKTREGVEHFVAWFYCHGVAEYALQDFVTPKQRRALTGPAFPETPDGPSVLAAMIWRSRLDLRAAFDIDTAAGRAGLATWFRQFGGKEYSLVTLLMTAT